MRKFVFITLALIGNFMAVDAAYPKQSKVKVINVSQVVDEDMNKIMHGEHPEIALEFSANTSLPLRLFLKGDVISLNVSEGNCPIIEVKQTFYVRRLPNDFLFSNDLTDWKPFSEFATGGVSLSLNFEEPNHFIEVGGEVNLR